MNRHRLHENIPETPNIPSFHFHNIIGLLSFANMFISPIVGFVNGLSSAGTAIGSLYMVIFAHFNKSYESFWYYYRFDLVLANLIQYGLSLLTIIAFVLFPLHSDILNEYAIHVVRTSDNNLENAVARFAASGIMLLMGIAIIFLEFLHNSCINRISRNNNINSSRLFLEAVRCVLLYASLVLIDLVRMVCFNGEGALCSLITFVFALQSVFLLSKINDIPAVRPAVEVQLWIDVAIIAMWVTRSWLWTLLPGALCVLFPYILTDLAPESMIQSARACLDLQLQTLKSLDVLRVPKPPLTTVTLIAPVMLFRPVVANWGGLLLAVFVYFPLVYILFCRFGRKVGEAVENAVSKEWVLVGNSDHYLGVQNRPSKLYAIGAPTRAERQLFKLFSPNNEIADVQLKCALLGQIHYTYTNEHEISFSYYQGRRKSSLVHVYKNYKTACKVYSMSDLGKNRCIPIYVCDLAGNSLGLLVTEDGKFVGVPISTVGLDDPGLMSECVNASIVDQEKPLEGVWAKSKRSGVIFICAPNAKKLRDQGLDDSHASNPKPCMSVVSQNRKYVHERNKRGGTPRYFVFVNGECYRLFNNSSSLSDNQRPSRKTSYVTAIHARTMKSNKALLYRRRDGSYIDQKYKPIFERDP